MNDRKEEKRPKADEEMTDIPKETEEQGEGSEGENEEDSGGVIPEGGGGRG